MKPGYEHEYTVSTPSPDLAYANGAHIMATDPKTAAQVFVFHRVYMNPNYKGGFGEWPLVVRSADGEEHKFRMVAEVMVDFKVEPWADQA